MAEVKNVTIDEIIEKQIKNYGKNTNIDLIKKAYNVASEQHKNQVRRSGEPYIIHPMAVAAILADLGMDDETICAALLHDVVEDTDMIHEDLVKEFGESIADMVAGVTKLGKIGFTTIEERQSENYRKMFLAMGKDIRVILIKLADRLHNMRTLKYLKPDRQYAIAKETMELFAPLANRLGIYSIKWELEDLAFKYLYPDDYHQIVKELDQKRDERLEFINKIKDDLAENIASQNIKAEITGRAKHLYSIYKKMQRDNKTLDQIYDLFALRILVDSVRDCYAALGIVHEMYTPMTGRFKDYIAVPKTNMYQSIHTTLLGPKGVPFEVQIRTWKMHKTAEYGIAAHWAYKESNINSDKKGVIANPDELSWLRESLEWQKNTENPIEFLRILKTELFEDEVYVFTPKGMIKELPIDSTPIDFAYAIHQEIGHRMIGCKINGKMMPITSKLNNGDIVEILTSDQQKGPSRDWLRFVKTSSAKTKINQWFKKTQRAENIEKGKEIVDKAIKKLGMRPQDLLKPEWIDIVLKRYQYATMDDLYASIGFGGISEQKVIARFLTEYKINHEEEDLEQKIQELSTSKPSNKRPSKTGIYVRGIDNCLVKLSKCCNPLPGDEIVGYITKGRGVSVHRTDCINLKDLIGQNDRMIEVYWSDEVKASYNVDIEIFANDRSGLLRDIIKQVENYKVKLMAVNTRTNRDNTATLDITIETSNMEEFDKLMKALNRVESVYDVYRKRG